MLIRVIIVTNQRFGMSLLQSDRWRPAGTERIRRPQTKFSTWPWTSVVANEATTTRESDRRVLDGSTKPIKSTNEINELWRVETHWDVFSLGIAHCRFATGIIKSNRVRRCQDQIDYRIKINCDLGSVTTNGWIRRWHFAPRASDCVIAKTEALNRHLYTFTHSRFGKRKFRRILRMKKKCERRKRKRRKQTIPQFHRSNGFNVKFEWAGVQGGETNSNFTDNDFHCHVNFYSSNSVKQHNMWVGTRSHCASMKCHRVNGNANENRRHERIIKSKKLSFSFSRCMLHVQSDDKQSAVSGPKSKEIYISCTSPVLLCCTIFH